MSTSLPILDFLLAAYRVFFFIMEKINKFSTIFWKMFFDLPLTKLDVLSECCQKRFNGSLTKKALEFSGSNNQKYLSPASLNLGSHFDLSGPNNACRLISALEVFPINGCPDFKVKDILLNLMPLEAL